MKRVKKITPITEEDFQKVIDNSVMGEGSRLVGSAAEQKKLFVKPIAAIDDGANVMQYVQNLANEAEESLDEVAEEIGKLVDEKQGHYDERLETNKKNVPDAINEVLGIANGKVTKATTPNRLYGTDAHGRAKLYELNEVGDIIGGEGEIGDIFQFVQELPEEGMKNVLYFVLKTDGEGNDLFDEWVWANKGTAEEPVYYWEYIGTKKISIDTSLFVKFTDIATESKAGVVRAWAVGGIGINTSNGNIYLSPATEQNIDNGTPARAPITVENYKYAVKKGLTTNTKTWTDEEKASACETIGAVKKMTNVTAISQVYAKAPDGTQTQYNVAQDVIANSIVQRTGTAILVPYTPTYQNSAICKQYAVDNFVAKPQNPTDVSVLSINTSGVIGAVRYSTQPANWSIPQANGKGNIKTNTPEEDLDCVPKKYAEDNFVTKPATGAENGSFNVVMPNGTTRQVNLAYSNYPSINGVPVYNTNKTIMVNDAVDDTDAPNLGQVKKYVDDNFVAKLTYESTYPIVYIKNANGTQGTLAVTNAPFGGGVVQRYDSGHIHVPAVPTSDVHATSKKYVDDAIAGVSGGGSGCTNLFLHRVYCQLTDDLGNQGIVATLMFANADESAYTLQAPDAEFGDVPSELISAFEDPLASPNSVSLYVEDENIKYFLSEVHVYDGVLWIGFSGGDGMRYYKVAGVASDDVTDFGG